MSLAYPGLASNRMFAWLYETYKLQKRVFSDSHGDPHVVLCAL
jgi:hypothetical protein